MNDALGITKGDVAWEELYTTSQPMGRAWAAEVAVVGLSVPQAIVLHCLDESPDALTPGDLSK